MSIALSIVLLLQCFDFYVSNARSLDVVVRIDSGKQLHYSTDKKNDETLNPVHTQSDRKYYDYVAGNPTDESRFGHDEPGNHSEGVKVGSNGAAAAAAVQSRWLVHQRKRRRDKNPGFNLDYSRPKTHPPVHN